MRTARKPFGGNKPYKKGELILKSDLKSAPAENVEVQIIDLPTYKYSIILVGGGGGDGGALGNGNWYDAGGSGAVVYLKIKLPKGTYRFTAGGKGKAGALNGGYLSTPGKSSKLERLNKDGTWTTLLTAGGGINGIYAYGGQGYGGTYTISADIEIIETVKVSNGVQGDRGGAYAGVRNGGASVYEGYGNGCSTYGAGGTGGLIELSSL